MLSVLLCCSLSRSPYTASLMLKNKALLRHFLDVLFIFLIYSVNTDKNLSQTFFFFYIWIHYSLDDSLTNKSHHRRCLQMTRKLGSPFPLPVLLKKNELIYATATEIIETLWYEIKNACRESPLWRRRLEAKNQGSPEGVSQLTEVLNDRSWMNKIYNKVQITKVLETKAHTSRH